MMRLLQQLWIRIFPDRRSDSEKARERQFIDAANALKTLSVTDRGGVSINAEEIRDQIIESREALKSLVAKSHRKPPSAQQKHSRSIEPETSINGLREVVTWRHLPSNTSVRYVCLQNMDENKFAIAVSDYFSGNSLPHPDSFEHRVAQRLRTVECGEPLAWYGSLQEAMDAHDADI